MTQLPDKVVLFDGVCNFCESSVQFILRHDKTGSLRFASLQSEIGQQLLTAYGISHELQSVVFVESGKAYTKSTAAFRIARYFGGWWKLLLVFSILPAFITDFGYDIIAKNRYRWFGKKDACMIPSADIRSRFLE
jgi:predicted DCC family thiol-disulfide oxidoreductase YuxK